MLLPRYAISSVQRAYRLVVLTIKSKASTVASAGFTSEVASALTSLQSEASSFFTALESTIDSSQASAISAAQTSVANAFSTTIADF